jgi:hypothetical protein
MKISLSYDPERMIMASGDFDHQYRTMEHVSNSFYASINPIFLALAPTDVSIKNKRRICTEWPIESQY